MIDLLPIHIDQRTGLLVVEYRTHVFGPIVRVRQYYVDETLEYIGEVALPLSRRWVVSW